MEKETSISEKKDFCHLRESLSCNSKEKHLCHSEPNEGNLVLELNNIAEFVKEKYNAHLWFVEIMGKRHSYIAGHKEDSFLPPEVIYISEKYAVVSNELEKITEKDEVISTIKTLISKEISK